MEDAKNRLTRLLSKERVIRKEKQEDFPHKDIDTSSITTPDNMDQTRRRVSRLLSKDRKQSFTLSPQKSEIPFDEEHIKRQMTKPISKPQREGGSPPHIHRRSLIQPRSEEFEMLKPPAGIKPVRDEWDLANRSRSLFEGVKTKHTSSKSSLAMKQRLSHKVPITEREPLLSRSPTRVRPHSLDVRPTRKDMPRYKDSFSIVSTRDEVGSDDSPILTSGYRRTGRSRTRSLSPPKRMRDESRVHFQSDDSIFELDLNVFQELNNSLSLANSAINVAQDKRDVYNELLKAGKELQRVGIMSLQVWEKDSDGLLSKFPANISSAQADERETQTVFRSLYNVSSISSSPTRSGAVKPTRCFTLIQEDPDFNEVIQMMVKEHPISDTKDLFSQRNATANHPSSWTAVHGFEISSSGGRNSDTPNVAVVLVAEINTSMLPFARLYGLKDHNMLKLRRFMTLNPIKAIVSAAGSRISAVQGEREKGNWIMRANEQESVLESQQILLSCASRLQFPHYDNSSLFSIVNTVADSAFIGDSVSSLGSWVIISSPSLHSNEHMFSSSQRGLHSFSDLQYSMVRVFHGPKNGKYAENLPLKGVVSPANRLLLDLVGVSTRSRTGSPIFSCRRETNLEELVDIGLFPRDEEDSYDGERGHELFDVPMTLVCESSQIPLVESFNPALENTSHNHFMVLTVVQAATAESSNTEVIKSHGQKLLQLTKTALNVTLKHIEEEVKHAFQRLPAVLYESVGFISPPSNVDTPAAELLSVLNRFQGNLVSELFGVRKAVLLVPEQFSSSVTGDSEGEGAEEYKSQWSTSIKFFCSVLGALKTVVIPPSAVAATYWLQELNEGNPVSFDVNSTVRSRYVSEYTSMRNSMEDSFNLLKSFVLSVDDGTKTAVLVPIKTKAGLCLMALLDREERTPELPSSPLLSNSFAQNIQEELVPFSPSYLEMLRVSTVAKTIGVLVDRCHSVMQQKTESVDLSEQLQIAESSQEKLLSIIEKQRHHQITSSYFKLWLSRTKQSKEHSHLLQSELFLRATMELTTHQLKFIQTGQAGKSLFVQALQDSVSRLFVRDVVLVSNDLSKDMKDLILDSDSFFLQDVKPDALVAIKDGNRCFLIGKVSFHDYSKQSDESHTSSPYHSTGPTRRGSFNPTGSNNHSSAPINVVAYITIARSEGMNSRVPALFSEEEQVMFGRYCEFASLIYGALHYGFRGALDRDGDVQALLAPMLTQLLPTFLFHCDPNRGASVLPNALPFFVHWLKRLCDADMVLLRLNGACSLSAHGHEEVILSSEDVDDQYLSSIQATLPHIHEFVHSAPSKLSAGSSIFSVSQSADQLTVKLRGSSEGHSTADAVPEILGEVKVLGHNKNFSKEQQTAIELLGYLLSHSVNLNLVNAELSKAENATMTKLSLLEEELESCMKERQSQKAATERASEKSTVYGKIVSFLREAHKAQSLQQLAGIIGTLLPQLVGCESAVLLCSATEEEERARSSHASAVQPTNYDIIVPEVESSQSTSPASAVMEKLSGSVVSSLQLSGVPAFFESPHENQTKVELNPFVLDSEDGGTKISKRRAAVLLFQSSESVTDAGSILHWSSNCSRDEWKLLSKTIEECLYGPIFEHLRRVYLKDCLKSVDLSLQSCRNVLKEKEHLEPKLGKLEGMKSELERQIEGLQSQYDELRKQAKEQLKEKEKQIQSIATELKNVKLEAKNQTVGLNEKISHLDGTLEKEVSVTTALKDNRELLLELASTFALDQRCQQRQSVMEWLQEFAESRDVTLVSIAQAEGGILNLTDEAKGVRGLLGAAVEAIRTGLAVEFSGAYSMREDYSLDGGNKSDYDLDWTYSTSKGQSFGVQELSRKASGSRLKRNLLSSFAGSFYKKPKALESDTFSVICVPNRCIPPSIENDQACFAFIRRMSGSDVLTNKDKFDQLEKDLFNCAANLCSFALQRSANRLDAEDFRELSEQAQQQKSVNGRLRRTLSAGESLRGREFKSKLDVCMAIEKEVTILLRRSSTDFCTIHCAVWLPPTVSGSGAGGSITPGTNRSNMPFLLNEGGTDMDALSHVMNSGRSLRKGCLLWTPLKGAKGDVVAILRTERKINERFDPRGGSATDSPDRSVNESVRSNQFTEMPSMTDMLITPLEEEILTTFAALAVPLLERMEFLEEAYAGVQQAGQAIMALQNVKVSVEDKYAAELSQRMELEEALKAGAELLGLTSSHRAVTSQLLDSTRRSILSVTSSVDCFIILPHSEGRKSPVGHETRSVDENSSEAAGYPQPLESQTDSALHYTVTPDQPQPLAVRLEGTDAEYLAIQTFRSITTPNSEVVSSAGVGGKSWQSWAVRRVQGKSNIAREIHGAEEEDYFSLAVPFVLRDGRAAVATMVRKTAPYSGTDRECVTWLSKVLAYCLETRVGEESFTQMQERILQMQRELTSLKTFEAKYQLLVERNNVLQEELRQPLSIPIFATEEGVESLMARSPALSIHSFDQEGIVLLSSVVKSALGEAALKVETASAAPEHIQAKFDLPIPLESFPQLDSASIRKTVLNSSSGTRLTYWLDMEGLLVKALRRASSFWPFQQEYSHETASTRDMFEADKQAVLLMLMQIQGFPSVWCKVVIPKQSTDVLFIRLLLLIRMLECQSPWRLKLRELQLGSQEEKAGFEEERRVFLQKLDETNRAIQQTQETNQSSLNAAKEMYKNVISQKSRQYKIAEKLVAEGAALAQTMRDEVLNAEVSSTEFVTWLQKKLIGVSKTLASSVDFSLSMGTCYFPDAASTSARVFSFLGGKKLDLQITAVSNPAPPPSVGMSMSMQSAPQMTWVTSEPSITWVSGAAVTDASLGPHMLIDHTSMASALGGSLKLAVSSGQLVVVLDEGTEGASQREPLSAVARKFIREKTDSAAEDPVIFVSPSNTISSHSFIVPIHLQGHGVTLVLVISPVNTNQLFSKHVMSAMLTTLLSLRSAVEQSTLGRRRLQTFMSQAERVGWRAIKRVLQVKEAESRNDELMKRLAFEKFRVSRVRSSLKASESILPQLRTAQAQVRILEQLTADWTEIVKGLNGASSDWQHGISGLWAQACRSLISLLSSQLTVQGCGLILADSNGGAYEMVEHSVRELKSPLPSSKKSRGSQGFFSDAPDYARGVIDSHPVANLGSKVSALVSDILGGRSSSQRIFKLSRSSSGSNNCMWLVPVRTARSVLAVLRVSAEVPRKDSSPRAAELAVGDDGVSTLVEEAALELAQSSMINFAEVMAPLLSACVALEKEKHSGDHLHESVKQHNVQIRMIQDELNYVKLRSDTLASVVTVLGTVGSRDWTAVKDSAEECLKELSCYIAASLSEIFDGRVVLHIYRNILTHSGAEDDSPQIDFFYAPHERVPANFLATEKLLDCYGSAFGTINFQSSQENVSVEDAQRIKFVFGSIASIVAGILCGVAREVTSKEKVAAAVENLHTFEGRLMTQQDSVAELEQRKKSIQSSNDTFQGLFKLAYQCLHFDYHLDSSGNRICPDTAQYSLSSSSTLLDLLQNITGMLPGIIGTNCLFNFAVLDYAHSGILEDISEAQRHMTWVYGEKEPSVSDELDWRGVLKNVGEVAVNLAHACVTKRSRSTFDVGVHSQQHETNNAEFLNSTALVVNKFHNIRVISIPLIHAGQKEPIGVLQCLVDMQNLADLNANGTSTRSPHEVEQLCVEIAKVVAHLVFQDVLRQQLFNHHHQTYGELTASESGVRQTHELKQVWQVRAEAWRGLAQVSASLVKGSFAVERFSDLLQSADVLLMLEKSGISITVHGPDIPSSSSAVIPGPRNPFAQVVVPLREGGILVEVNCDPSRIGSLDDSHLSSSSFVKGSALESIAPELVHAAAEVIRAAETAHALKQKERAERKQRNSSMLQKTERLKGELVQAKAELNEMLSKSNRTASDLQQQLSNANNLCLKANSAISLFYTPTVQEMAELLEEVTDKIYASASSAVESPLTEMDWMWSSFSKVVDRATGRICGRNFPYHVSILVRQVQTPSIHGKRERREEQHQTLSLKLYDASRHRTEVTYTLTASHDRSSILEKAFKDARSTETSVFELQGSSATDHALTMSGDLLGIDAHDLNALRFNSIVSTSTTDEKHLSLIVLALKDQRGGTVGAIRVVYASDAGAGGLHVSNESKASEGDLLGSGLASEELFSVKMLRPTLEMLRRFGVLMIHQHSMQFLRVREIGGVVGQREQEREKAENAHSLLSRARKLYRVVCREASSLLDPPIVAALATTNTPASVHPASLSPLAASQDTCLKLLGMVRTLLRAEGQALLLKDPVTEPTTYQVIYTGDSIRWPGVEQGTFGLVSTATHTQATGSSRVTSLAETTMQMRKALVVEDAAADVRYSSYLDGICSVGTPMLMVPMRGRAGCVVGVLTATRRKGSSGFTHEDIAAAELCSCLGALSLYWCQGLGTLHHQLNKNINKLEHLEKAVRKFGGRK